jgi:NAD(P)-dependent dehydrogenase (short-subunit alcohol dehydrogenase family)
VKRRAPARRGPRPAAAASEDAARRRVALVTGATGGIGRATCRSLAEAGIRVLVHYRRDSAAAERLCDALPGGGHAIVQGDLARPNGAARLAQAALRVADRIDVLVNNAGLYEEHPLTEVDFDTWQAAWRRTLALNLLAPADLCWCIGRHMVEQGGGRIINVSSRGAFRGEPTAPAYGASKAGLNALSQSLAQALAPHGVFVYVVAPGFVETEMVTDMLRGKRGAAIRAQSPLNRVARPAEVAHAIAFLAQGETEYLTGAIVDVNGASYLRS